MIKLTKLGGKECLLNHTLFELIEESPDTCITLSNGNRYVVLETGQQIREKIIDFNARILQKSSQIEPCADQLNISATAE